MSRFVAIHQPNYLPWLGYFSKMLRADLFVYLDDVPPPNRGYGNRVKIKGRLRPSAWLTVPLRHGTVVTSYHDAVVSYDEDWAGRHLNLIRDAYAAAPYFSTLFPRLEQRLRAPHDCLADLNLDLLDLLRSELGATSEIVRASELGRDFGTRADRILGICRHLGATTYLSGRGGRNYLVESDFDAAGIELDWLDFSCPEYSQPHGDFVPNLSLIDLLMNCGPESLAVLEGGGQPG